MHAELEFLKLINWKVAAEAAGRVNPADASATKVFGTEFFIEAYRLLIEIVGPAAASARLSPPAPCSAAGSSVPSRARSS